MDSPGATGAVGPDPKMVSALLAGWSGSGRLEGRTAAPTLLPELRSNHSGVATPLTRLHVQWTIIRIYV
ncbi:hypothetical protein CVV68_15990 [Arthrobacter livingstonensis]|uniref:Uncharacterized protein n=1 Tax=Arthrobacter livingstonensis TaxID=670078 RepID=A0A2V5L730_9MICC|nr:hypothetical protein [Arthrobacter livingstonensis]PYI66084.1 hypothetical protein CVV68_15990 [Arthrobacter livingstonensis]